MFLYEMIINFFDFKETVPVRERETERLRDRTNQIKCDSIQIRENLNKKKMEWRRELFDCAEPSSMTWRHHSQSVLHSFVKHCSVSLAKYGRDLKCFNKLNFSALINCISTAKSATPSFAKRLREFTVSFSSST